MNLTCKIIERKGDEVIVEIEKQQIKLPIESFPKDVQTNQQYQIFLWDNISAPGNKKLAQHILEEILNGK